MKETYWFVQRSHVSSNSYAEYEVEVNEHGKERYTGKSRVVLNTAVTHHNSYPAAECPK